MHSFIAAHAAAVSVSDRMDFALSSVRPCRAVAGRSSEYGIDVRQSWKRGEPMTSRFSPSQGYAGVGKHSRLSVVLYPSPSPLLYQLAAHRQRHSARLKTCEVIQSVQWLGHCNWQSSMWNPCSRLLQCWQILNVLPVLCGVEKPSPLPGVIVQCWLYHSLSSAQPVALLPCMM